VQKGEGLLHVVMSVSVCACVCRDLYTYLRVGPPLYMVVGPVSVAAESPDVNKLCSVAGCRTDSLAVRVRGWLSEGVRGSKQGGFSTKDTGSA